MGLNNSAQTHSSGAVSSPSKIREFLWPIYGRENLKFLPMTCMISLMLFNYTVLRNIKDSLIVSNCGAEAVTYLKMWAVVPAALIIVLIYSKLSNVLSKKALFYTTISPFLLYFALFAFVIYPNRSALQPDASADWLLANLPSNLKALVELYRFWTYSLFYTLAEMWGSVVLSLTFWQLANDVTSVKEAKRHYSHFYLLANIAVSLAGVASYHFSTARGSEGADAWGTSLNYLLSMVVVAGLVIMSLYFILTTFILKDAALVPAVDELTSKKKKPKLSMLESVKFLLHSRYLGLISILVICYGVAINLIEVTWKHQVHLLHPTENGYNAYMGVFYTVMGVSTFVIILVGSAIVRKFGWKKGALATPLMLGACGMLFYACIIFQGAMSPMFAFLNMTPYFAIAGLGLIMNVLGKGTKYALFDPTTQMAYIPLDEESKVKGKAAIDVVGARLGKSGGSLMQQAMFIFIGPLSVITPYLGALLLAIILIWTVAVSALSKDFHKLSADAD